MRRVCRGICCDMGDPAWCALLLLIHAYRRRGSVSKPEIYLAHGQDQGRYSRLISGFCFVRTHCSHQCSGGTDLIEDVFQANIIQSAAFNCDPVLVVDYLAYGISLLVDCCSKGPGWIILHEVIPSLGESNRTHLSPDCNILILERGIKRTIREVAD